MSYHFHTTIWAGVDTLVQLAKKAIPICLSLGVCNMAQANDGFGQIGLGGLIFPSKTQSVAMEQELLIISSTKIHVDYVFRKRISNGIVRNDTSELTFPVLFPLPLYGPQDPSPRWAGAPANFNVTVNGRQLPFHTQVKARSSCTWERRVGWSCEKDVTKELKAEGLTDAQIALFPIETPFYRVDKTPVPITKLKPSQLSKLASIGLIEGDYPNWMADVSYVWQMKLYGNEPLNVSHEYTPFSSSGSNGDYLTEDELRNDYCADDKFIGAWKAMAPANLDSQNPYFGPIPARKIDYILTTANSWAEPIRNFTLRLKKDNPSSLVALCFPGKFKKIDPLTLEVSLKNFEPKNELRVIFINVSPHPTPSDTGQAPAGLLGARQP